MILDQNGRVILFGAGVFEVATQFLILGIVTNDRQSLRGESFFLLRNVEELLITVRALGGGDLFAVHAKPEVHLF